MGRCTLNLVYFTLFLLALFSNRTTPKLVDKMGYFKARPCSQTDLAAITEAKLFKPVKTTRLTCAFSCNLNAQCNLGVFNSSDKSCKHLTDIYQSTDNSLESQGKEETVDGCIVLIKKINTYPSGWHPVDIQTLRNVNNVNHWSLKLVVDDGPLRAIYPASLSFSGDKNVINTPAGAFASFNFEQKRFQTPISSTLKQFTEHENQTKITITIDNNIGSGNETSTFSFLAENLWPNVEIINTSGESSVDVVTSAVRKGYRRVQGHHLFRARTEMTDINDVYFDATEMFYLGSFSSPGTPFYYTCKKESVGTGKTYQTSYDINDGKSLRYVEKQIDSHWVFDTSWIRLEPTGDESMLEAVQRSVIAGNDIRIVIDGRLSADYTSIWVTSTDVILILSEYLEPMKGSIFINESSAKGLTYSVFGAVKNTLLNCKMKYQQNAVIKNNVKEDVRNVDWFVSSRNWTKMIEIESDQTVISGNHQDLYSATIQGKNIRACLVGPSGKFKCYRSNAVYLRKGRVIVFTESILVINVNQDKTLRSIKNDCIRKVRAISSEGWTALLKFSSQGALSEDNVYQRQLWFVEND